MSTLQEQAERLAQAEKRLTDELLPFLNGLYEKHDVRLIFAGLLIATSNCAAAMLGAKLIDSANLAAHFAQAHVDAVNHTIAPTITYTDGDQKLGRKQ